MTVIEIPCNFVGDFKVGDNLVYNCRLLCNLVNSNEIGSFNKMIVLQAGSILEASLIQIIYRAQNFNREGVPNIIEADRQKIVGSKIDKFAVVIDVLRKYDVLDGVQGNAYEELHRLRKYRNKIHIQEDVKIEGVSRDEGSIFVADLVTQALKTNRTILQFLSSNLARPAHIHGYVGGLKIATEEQ